MKQHLRRDLAAPDLVEFLSLNNDQFKRHLQIRRCSARNAAGSCAMCVALGNMRACPALPALERATSDPEPLIAEHARWAIERITKAR